jgi:hypothetical protein
MSVEKSAQLVDMSPFVTTHRWRRGRFADLEDSCAASQGRSIRRAPERIVAMRRNRQ